MGRLIVLCGSILFVLARVCWLPASTFTVAVLPDTQFYSEQFPEQFIRQTQWIAGNYVDENIVFVSHVGDIVENGADNILEWDIADAALQILDEEAPSLPYGVAVGNHDYDRVNSTLEAESYVHYFGAERYEDRSWYGGSSPREMDHFQRFTAGGRSFLHLTLQWRPDGSSISWAQSIIDNNPNVPTILTTHEYLLPGGERTSTGTDLFRELINNNSEIFMVLSGHVPGEGQKTVRNSEGLEVFEMLADYQFRANGGDGWLRLIEFDEENAQMNVKTYSPTRDEFETDFDSQFTLNVDFNERFGVVPEPSTVGMLFGLVLAAIGWRRRVVLSDMACWSQNRIRCPPGALTADRFT